MIRVFVTIACVLLMCSCAPNHANERFVLGGGIATASFGGEHSVVELEQTRRDRASWPVQIVVAPTDGTITWRTLRTANYLSRDDPPRLYGRFPTADDVLDPQDRGAFSEYWWTLDEFGRSVGELVLMPYRVIIYAFKGLKTWSPERTWKRRPAQAEWSSGQPRLIQGASDVDADE